MNCPNCGSERIETKWCGACYRTGVDKTTGTECDCIQEPDTCTCEECLHEWELGKDDYEVICVSTDINSRTGHLSRLFS